VQLQGLGAAPGRHALGRRLPLRLGLLTPLVPALAAPRPARWRWPPPRAQDYSAHSCLKIIGTKVGAGDAHGCPYKTMSEAQLRASLQRLRTGDRFVCGSWGGGGGGARGQLDMRRAARARALRPALGRPAPFAFPRLAACCCQPQHASDSSSPSSPANRSRPGTGPHAMPMPRPVTPAPQQHRSAPDQPHLLTGAPPGGRRSIGEAVAKARAGHFQLACACAFEGISKVGAEGRGAPGGTARACPALTHGPEP
jgi:hypothetical protein